MSAHRLVAIVSAADAARMQAAAAPADLATVVADDLAALLLPAEKPLAAWLRTRKAAMAEVLDFQRLLERLSAAGPVLPAAHGSALVTMQEAAALLSLHAGAISRDLAEFGHRVQFQIDVRWDPKKAMAALKADGRMAGLDMSLAGRDRRAFGVALQALMEAERRRLAAEFRATLADVCRDLVILPLADETAVLNCAALIDRADEPALDKAVEAIDAAMPDALAIRYLGPLPAVSFASVVVSAQDRGAVALSMKRLGLTDGAPAADVTAAYRREIRAAHPDAGGAEASADAAADLAAAYALALRAAAAPRTARGAALLLDIRREGEGAERQAGRREAA